MRKIFVVISLCSPFLLSASYFPLHDIPNRGYQDQGYYYQDDVYYHDGQPYQEDAYFGNFDYPNQGFSQQGVYDSQYADDQDDQDKGDQKKEGWFGSSAEKEQKRLGEMQKKYPQDRAATLSDAQLNMKIRDKISEGWLWRSYEKLGLNTNNGMVTITGVVEKPRDEEKIIAQIRKIPGVRGVNTNLQYKE